MENNVNGVLWLPYGYGICFSHYIGYKIDIISNVGVINNGTESYTCMYSSEKTIIKFYYLLLLLILKATAVVLL
mgnify:FL=1